MSNILYSSTQTNGYRLEGIYRADFNSTVPPLHYICNYNNKYPGSFGSCEILHWTKKRHFLCREIILHQTCESTLKHKLYLYYPMSQGTRAHTQCSSMPKKLIGAIRNPPPLKKKKKKKKMERDKMHF